MGKIIFITGGARSGKSRFAEQLLKGEDNVLYVATGIAFDDEMKDRIAKHRSLRNGNWKTLEAYRDFDKILPAEIRDRSYILIDCITIMVSNIMLLDKDIDWDNIATDTANSIENEVTIEIKKLLKAAEDFSGKTLIVSNELGMGVVPPSPLGRYYRDIAGRMNQLIADVAETVYFVVSGIPVKIKG
jgi:adenosylcobinamide kinase / adenosylcobinamide-phosphate guanylyltransferase